MANGMRQSEKISGEYKTAMTQRTFQEIENIPCWPLASFHAAGPWLCHT
jgi:hypothetical protein